MHIEVVTLFPQLIEDALRRLMGDETGLRGWGLERAHRVNSGFYLSQALEATPS